MNVDPETGEKYENGAVYLGNVETHGYNIQPRLVRPIHQFNLLQTRQQSAYMEHPKPHVHIMLTQMSDKAGIKNSMPKSNNPLIKELNLTLARRIDHMNAKEDIKYAFLYMY